MGHTVVYCNQSLDHDNIISVILWKVRTTVVSMSLMSTDILPARMLMQSTTFWQHLELIFSVSIPYIFTVVFPIPKALVLALLCMLVVASALTTLSRGNFLLALRI